MVGKVWVVVVLLRFDALGLLDLGLPLLDPLELRVIEPVVGGNELSEEIVGPVCVSGVAQTVNEVVLVQLVDCGFGGVCQIFDIGGQTLEISHEADDVFLEILFAEPVLRGLQVIL